jgi:uncharacterized lipoprotein YddW (UPF0748 family)
MPKRLSHTIATFASAFVREASARPAAPLQTPAPAIQPRDSEHAIWVTRWDYRTAADITRIAANCKDAGVDTILFQVRGNATVSYRSSIEPWSELFDYKDPGFDPLANMIEAAHTGGMRVVAWVNVMPAWYGPTAPTSPSQVWNKHPEWLWYDQKGVRQGFSEKFYVSLNPCLPEVRTYLVSVVEEIVTRYEVDGVHLDYIRFPNENPAIPTGSGIDYPRDKQTLKLFKEFSGKSPDDDRAGWNQWRTDQVTAVVRQIRLMLRARKRSVELSAAVGVTRANALGHFQDAERWLSEDLVDAVYPMNYTADSRLFGKRCDVWKSAAKSKRVVMGVMFEKGMNETLRVEVQRGLDQFNGFAAFAYGSLFETPNDAVDRPDEASRAQRDALRQAVLPWLRTMKPSTKR